MRRYSQRQSLSTLSEINVTPLLDLAFVLLIIFIITTPLMDKSVDLILPSSAAASNAVDPAAVQTIAINRDAVMTLNNQPIRIDELETSLAGLKQNHPEIAVVIRSHKELPVQRLIDVMDKLQRAQITKIGVVTNPE
jgi:biopolymer transport protein ExbD